MEKYSKAVSEMYSQFKKKEAHPMEKYIGKHAGYLGCEEEVVGYTTWPDGSCSLIVNSSQKEGWTELGPYDVILKKCESYWYVSISDLID
jgi:hypothetical protein